MFIGFTRFYFTTSRFVLLTFLFFFETQTGVIHSTLIALDYMDKSKGGQGGLIVNISSVTGLEPSGMFAIYSAAKCGLTAFTRALAVSNYYSYFSYIQITYKLLFIYHIFRILYIFLILASVSLPCVPVLLILHYYIPYVARKP